MFWDPLRITTATTWALCTLAPSLPTWVVENILSLTLSFDRTDLGRLRMISVVLQWLKVPSRQRVTRMTTARKSQQHFSTSNLWLNPIWHWCILNVTKEWQHTGKIWSTHNSLTYFFRILALRCDPIGYGMSGPDFFCSKLKDWRLCVISTLLF